MLDERLLKNLFDEYNLVKKSDQNAVRDFIIRPADRDDLSRAARAVLEEYETQISARTLSMRQPAEVRAAAEEIPHQIESR